MTAMDYPLVPAALGRAVPVKVGNLVAPTLFEAFGTCPDGVVTVPVSLDPHPLSGTWRVRLPRAFGAVIGDIDAGVRAEYGEVDRVHEAGANATAEAAVAFDAARASFSAAVSLAPCELIMPRNNPVSDAVVLPTGTVLPVEVGSGEFTAAETMAMSPGQWLVELRTVGGAVVAVCDGRPLGAVDSPQLKKLIDAHHAPSRPLMARAFAVGGAISIDADLSGATPVELASFDLPEPFETAAWEVYEYADGTLAITVEREAAIDPEDWRDNPNPGARQITGPVSPASVSAGEDTPTQYFPAPVGFTPPATESVDRERTYLTEVEKVRLRRAQRASGGARHRLGD